MNEQHRGLAGVRTAGVLLPEEKFDVALAGPVFLSGDAGLRLIHVGLCRLGWRTVYRAFRRSAAQKLWAILPMARLLTIHFREVS